MPVGALWWPETGAIAPQVCVDLRGKVEAGSVTRQAKKHESGGHSRTIDRSLWGPEDQERPQKPNRWFDSVVVFNPDQLGPLVGEMMEKARKAGCADAEYTIEGGLFTVYTYDQWQLAREGKEPKH